MEQAAFSLASATPNQMIAFFSGAIAHTLFFVWLAYLAMMK